MSRRTPPLDPGAIAFEPRKPPAIVLSPSGQDKSDAVVAWLARRLERHRQSGGGSTP